MILRRVKKVSPQLSALYQSSDRVTAVTQGIYLPSGAVA